AATTGYSCEVILPHEPRSGNALSLSHRLRIGEIVQHTSLCFQDEAITDVPCFNERLTCAVEQRRSSSQENAIPGSSAPEAHRVSGDRRAIVRRVVMHDLEHLRWTRDDADRHQE